jgi:glycosyltransferase involved in cell wall biosynthesis
MKLVGRDIVCVGSADWATELPINQHQLMRRLAQGNRVLFVESLGLRRPQLAGRDLSRLWRRLRRGLRGAQPADGLHVLAPLVLPLHGNAAVRRLNRALLRLQVKRAARRLGMTGKERDCLLLWAYVPQAEDLIDVLDPDLVIYHCVDDVAAQKGVDAESFRAAERRFAGGATLVLASAPALAQRMETLSRHVLYAPNVADTGLFATALEPGPVDPALAALPRPRLVFQGAVVATKLDIGLVAELAARRPQWSVVLVGPRGAGDPGGDLSALDAAANVHLLGPRAEGELPGILRGADAGLIPYAVNDLTRSVFPMKVYEYLAAGLPVLSTPLPALAGVEGIEIVSDAAAFEAAAERELELDSPQRRAERSRAAAAHSWTTRLAEIEAALAPVA